jgi:hypothetical protein
MWPLRCAHRLRLPCPRYTRRDASLAKGTELCKNIGASMTEFANSVSAPDVGNKDSAARRSQLNRLKLDFQSVSGQQQRQ